MSITSLKTMKSPKAVKALVCLCFYMKELELMLSSSGSLHSFVVVVLSEA